MFINQKVYSIYCYHWHFALSPPKLQKYLTDSFTYSIIPHPWCITLDSFPDLSKKIRVQDPLLPKLGFLIFRTPGTVAIYQHLVWGLPKKPWKKHWEIISAILLRGPLLTFMIHCEPVFWHDPKNTGKLQRYFPHQLVNVRFGQINSGVFQMNLFQDGFTKGRTNCLFKNPYHLLCFQRFFCHVLARKNWKEQPRFFCFHHNHF